MSTSRIVWLVMRRELRARLFSRAFVIGLAVIVVLISAVSFLSAALDDDAPIRLGLAGEQPSGAVATLEALAEAVETEVEIIELSGRGEAEQRVADGELDAAVVDGELLMEQTSNQIVALVGPAWQQAGLIDGLTGAGLDATQVDGVLGAAAPVEVVELDPDPDADAREAVAFASVILMFIAIQVAGSYIMLGIFEEKTTKVVELVLASVPARYLLAGKILGIAVIGLIQVAVLVLTALVASAATGSSALPALSPSLLGTAVIWFLIGYLLYGAVFAAGASLAPRQEDAQSTLAPISMILLISYIAVLGTSGDPTGWPSRVVSWIPLTSPFAMPGRIAANAAPWWEIVGSMLVGIVAVVGVLLATERIYVRSVIHTDRKLGWREAWSLPS
ncbi:MAG: ABC transporter permease [Actinomycetota bacterium]